MILPQDMSVICSRPSMPPRSTKAPYSVMFLMTPLTICPSASDGERFFLFHVLMLLQEGPAGKHDIAAAGVHLDDLQVQALADHLVEVMDGLDVDLRARAGTPHSADIDGQAALDRREHPSFDRRPGLIGAVQIVPDLQFFRLFPREHQIAVRVFRGLEQDLEFIAGLEGLQFLFRELLHGNDAVRLVSEVQHHHAGPDLQHPAPDHRSRLKALQRLVVELFELLLIFFSPSFVLFMLDVFA